MRLSLIATAGLAGSLVAGCALWPSNHWRDMDALARSDYCGTPSEASNVTYFANAAAFQIWINNRSIRAFDADMAAGNGAIVVEMGLRPTGGYSLELDPDKTNIADNTLTIAMEWQAPGLDAKVSQAFNSQCVVFNPPRGDYSRIELVDQLGDRRGSTSVDRGSGGA